MTAEALSHVTIRRARVEDARQIIEHYKTIASEPGVYLAFTSQEADIPVEVQADAIKSLEQDHSLYLIAELDGEIIGELTCRGVHYEADHHVVTLGMTIKKEYRNQRIGTLLMQEVIRWARETGFIKRIQLEVYKENTPAIHLYKKFGFELEGCKKNMFFQRGRYFDVLIMGLLL